MEAKGLIRVILFNKPQMEATLLLGQQTHSVLASMIFT